MTEISQNPTPNAPPNGGSGASEPGAYQQQERAATSTSTPASESATGHTAAEAGRLGRKSSSSEVRR